jgi:hypothetical protein
MLRGKEAAADCKGQFFNIGGARHCMNVGDE